MSVGKIISGLNLKQLLSLVGWFFKHPLYMICTISATMQAFKIVQKEFPNIHGLDNKANAFRHALWNLLIARKCLRVEKDLEAVLNWTTQITNWHEDFSPNKELMRVMDLHNNMIGREMFKLNQGKEMEELQVELKRKLSDAVLVSSVKEISQLNDTLVYLKD
ncbi:MAG: hypothetical protein KUG51_03865 [Urechidicola sp.]|nr:hypothetical protein [Urechidicola sp.]